nr:hypothetical protein [uncultured archaeon]
MKNEKRDTAIEEEAKKTYEKSSWLMIFIADYFDLNSEKRITKYL